MDALPSVGCLQSSIIHGGGGADDDLTSILCHLLVCAIEDPGVGGCSPKHTTILGQTLARADVTPNTVSEILRIYLSAAAHQEVSCRITIQECNGILRLYSSERLVGALLLLCLTVYC